MHYRRSYMESPQHSKELQSGDNKLNVIISHNRNMYGY